MDWAQILVIILSVFLAVFLGLAIILTAMLIKVTKQIKTVTGSAQHTAEMIERAMAGVTKVTSPMLMIKMVTKFMKKARNSKEG